MQFPCRSFKKNSKSFVFQLQHLKTINSSFYFHRQVDSWHIHIKWTNNQKITVSIWTPIIEKQITFTNPSQNKLTSILVNTFVEAKNIGPNRNIKSPIYSCPPTKSPYFFIQNDFNLIPSIQAPYYHPFVPDILSCLKCIRLV